MRRRTLLAGMAFGIGAGVTVFISGPVLASSTFTGATDGIAINGYDPVAYFAMNKPVKGVPDHTFEWQDVTWQFASAANKETFMSDPEKYAPQYGGFCAYAMAQGQKAKTDPQAFSIVGDRLYLNYSIGVRERWNADQASYISSADKKWPGVK